MSGFAEANATVSPFDSAGVPLPTEGVAYNQTLITEGTLVLDVNSPNSDAVPIVAAPVPGAQDYYTCYIPHAQPGEVLDVEFEMPVIATDPLTPPDSLVVVSLIADDRVAPSPRIWLPLNNATVVLFKTPDDVYMARLRYAVEVPLEFTGGLTVGAFYTVAGDPGATVDYNAGATGTGFMKVRRYRRERILTLPRTVLQVVVP